MRRRRWCLRAFRRGTTPPWALGASPIALGWPFDGLNFWVYGHRHFMQPDAIPIQCQAVLTDAQGQLTDQAKAAIIEALPEDYQYLEGIKGDSNGFIQSVIIGSSDRDYQITESMSDYRDYIDNSKGG